MINPKIRAIYYSILGDLSIWGMWKIDYEAYYETAVSVCCNSKGNIVGGLIKELFKNQWSCGE